jgi:hypothetical protein
MENNILVNASALSDQDLLARLVTLAGKEREASVELVAHLAALDSRPALFAAQGYSSLFSYCTQALRLSEDAACNRIEAARTCRRFPLILELLASSFLSLTSVRLLGKHLTAKNHQSVLAKARYRSRREIEVLIAELAPRPDLPSTVRKLPMATPPTATPLTATPPPSAGASPAMTSVSSAAGPAIAPSLSPPPATPRPVVQALAPERYRVQFTIGQETHENLGRLQELRRREIPNGDPGAIFDRALTVLLDKVGKTKLGAADKPRPHRPVRSGAGPNGSIRLGTDKDVRKPTVRSAMFHGRSSARSGAATPASAPSCPLPDADARSARSWSSTTSWLMRRRGRPPSPTSPFAVGATTNTRPSWSSARMARRSSGRRARPSARLGPDRAERSTPSRRRAKHRLSAPC